MNNQRLLTGLLSVVLSGAGVCAYGDTVTTLEEIFASAEAGSIQLRPCFTAEQEAQEGIRVAKSERLPDISANLSFSFLGDGFTTRRNFSDYQKAAIPHFGNGLGLNVTQPVYTGGAITTGIEMADLKKKAAGYTTEQARDYIRFQLTGYYLDIYKFNNLRRVVESNIKAARKVLDEMQARFEQGTVLKNDITRYELLVSNLELQLLKINNTLSILNSNLVKVAGLPPDTQIVPDSTILSAALPLDGVEWWHKEGETNSPSLHLARTGMEMSRSAEKLVKSDRLPKVGLQAAWTLDGPILVEVPPINRNLSYWYVGVGVSYNLSSLYKSNKALSKSRLAVRKAEEDYDSALEQLSIEINVDYIRYLEAYEELKTQKKSVELADKNYNTTSTRYSADMALITDMLDAANSKLEAEQELVNARINIIYYYYKLLYITGKI